MMQYKSLSDSSSSESEDEGYQSPQKDFSISFPPLQLSDESSCESEDDLEKKLHQSIKPSFQSGTSLKCKLDSNEDLGPSGKNNNSDSNSEFKSLVSHLGLDLSSSESDDDSSVEHSVSREAAAHKDTAVPKKIICIPHYNETSKTNEKLGFISGTSSDSSSSESDNEDNKIPQKDFFTCNAPTQISDKSSCEGDLERKLHQSIKPSFQTRTSLKRKLESNEDLGPSRKKNNSNANSEFKLPVSHHGLDLTSSDGADSSVEYSVSREAAAHKNTAAPKKIVSTPHYNETSKRMMEKMGFISGTGLGKKNQGITQIIEASKHQGRRGLGLHIEGLEPENIEWDFQKEQETAEEDFTWIPSCNLEVPLMSELCDWVKEGKAKRKIDDETNFCEPSILKNVLGFKNVFDNLAPGEMRTARSRSNPFETIHGGIFLNRAAMKMANIDAVFKFMFTEPTDKAGRLLVTPRELLYFADICSGPGGFSEYILWRKKWKCKGFGFTLKGKNDFRLENFFAGPPETFEPYYGANGMEGDGNIYSAENLLAFQSFVMSSTDNKGVHFVMADGGFSVEGEENLQEILSKQLYLCQFLCSMMTLRTGGYFVCKLFDLFTVFSVGLVYLMYRAFENVTIFKPNTSRPANSERYIICKGKKDNTKDICDYMFALNKRLNEIPKGSDRDISEVVPLDVIKSDEKFFNYICDSNNVIGERQILHLAKIRAFTQNSELHEFKQDELRRKCLEIWKVPDKVRTAPSKLQPVAKFKELLKREQYSRNVPEALNAQSLVKLKHIFEFKAVVCGEAQNQNPAPSFFISLGRTDVYKLCSKTSKWLKVELKLELPAETLFYGELIYELKGEGRAQRKILSLHVIDVLFLGGTDVRHLHFEERMAEAQMLARAVAKPSRPDYTHLKVKQIWGLEDIKSVLDRLSMQQIKGSRACRRLCYNLHDKWNFIPSGLMIFRTVAEHWVVAFSKSQQRQYYFHTKKNKSMFERLPESAANFKACYENRIFWSWERRVNLLEKPSAQDEKSLVHSHTFCPLVQEQFKFTTGQTLTF